MFIAPPERSPPIRFWFQCSSAAGGETERAIMQGEPPLGRDDLLQRSPKMDGGGAGTLLCRPWDGRIESVVDFERTSSILKFLELLTVS